MTTVNDIVTLALRKTGVAAIGETPASEDAAEGLTAFNMMLHEWKLRGVNTYHSDQTLSDTFALAPEYEDGTVHMLAARLGATYKFPPGFDADDWFRAVQAAYATIDEVEIPSTLKETVSQRRYY